MYSPALIQPFLPEQSIDTTSLPDRVAPDLFREILARQKEPLLVFDLKDCGRVARVEMVNTQFGQALQVASFAIAKPTSGLVKIGQDSIPGDYIVPLWRVLAFKGMGSDGGDFISSRVLYPDLEPPTPHRLLDLAARIEGQLNGVVHPSKGDSEYSHNLMVATRNALALSSIRGSTPYAPLPRLSY